MKERYLFDEALGQTKTAVPQVFNMKGIPPLCHCARLHNPERQFVLTRSDARLREGDWNKHVSTDAEEYSPSFPSNFNLAREKGTQPTYNNPVHCNRHTPRKEKKK